MACDICGETGTELSPLLDSYQTKEIKAVCPDCLKVINKELWKIKELTNNIRESLFKRFMGAMRLRKTRE